MVDTPSSDDRRSNVALRRLIDELLSRVRAADDKWTPAERQTAEKDLERILAGLRSEALRDRGK